MNVLHIPRNLKKIRDIIITKQELIDFEAKVADYYNDGKIKAAIHLSKGNEDELIEIFQYVHPDDWVFSAWRNHYHALLHGMSPDTLFQDILNGRSMSTSYKNFYASSIVGGIIPIAVGTAFALKLKVVAALRETGMVDGEIDFKELRPNWRKVWCFIGDMSYRTGIFYEAYKYTKNFNLPLQFVIEDNGMSVHTPTEVAWGSKLEVLDDIIYYTYKLEYPHHGTGKFLNF